MLKAGMRRLHRAHGTVQFGADPERAVLLTDLDASAQALLAGLDNRSPAPPRTELLARLQRHGLLEDAATPCPGWRALPARDRERLEPDLASMSLVDPGPGGGRRAMSRRFAACVEVRGAGRVGASLANLLAAAGVGEIRVVDDEPTRPADLAPAGLRPAHLNLPRGRAATPRPLALPVRNAARRRLPRPRVSRAEDHRVRGVAPDLVVLAADDGVPPAATDLWPAGVPHLVAGVREAAGIIGPLVLPTASSCLRCHDLIRADRDPDWPTLAAQLALPVSVVACDVVLATAVASHAALQVLSFLDTGSASTVDGTLHVAMPDGAVRRRSWHVHPACGCTWPGAV
jgi:hypothetical protein